MTVSIRPPCLLYLSNYQVGHNTSAAYNTQDCDILICPDPIHLGRAVRVLQAQRYVLRAGSEPLIKPDTLTLRRLVKHRAVVRATKSNAASIDLVLQAKGFTFAQWRQGRRMFLIGGVKVPVANLSKLLRSKELAGREKDRIFLNLYKSQVKDWIKPYAARKDAVSSR